nr:hypothetical protein [Tanacetum cinerariifolium]
MAFISSTIHSRGNDKVNTASVYTASSNVPTASANVATVSISQETACAYIASQSGGSQIKFEDINQINEDDMEEMDIKWNMAFLSMRADKAPRNQERGRRDTYRQGSKTEEQTPKALMAIDRVGWDWSYMANDEEDHALVAEAPTEFALMADTSTENNVFDKSLCSKDLKEQGGAKEQVQDDVDNAYVQGDNTAVPGDVVHKPSIPSPTLPTPPLQQSQDLPSTSQVQHTLPQSPLPQPPPQAQPQAADFPISLLQEALDA